MTSFAFSSRRSVILEATLLERSDTWVEARSASGRLSLPTGLRDADDALMEAGLL